MNPLGIVKGIIGPWYGQPSTAELQAQVDRLHQDKMSLVAQLATILRERDEAVSGRTHWRDRATLWSEVASDRGQTLRTIAAQETPGANATVQRMARIAREALE